jgi:hypothetical protein
MSDYEAYSPEAPKERVKVERDEIAAVVRSAPIAKELLDWLNAQADKSTDVEDLAIDEKTPDSEAKLQILLAKRQKAAFQSKAKEFQSKFGQYIETGGIEL